MWNSITKKIEKLMDGIDVEWSNMAIITRSPPVLEGSGDTEHKVIMMSVTETNQTWLLQPEANRPRVNSRRLP
jgi:hypothetical protein